MPFLEETAEETAKIETPPLLTGEIKEPSFVEEAPRFVEEPQEEVLRQAKEPTLWQSAKNMFRDPEKEEAKAVKALVDAEAFNITPSAAFRLSDSIDRGVKINPIAASRRSNVTERVKQQWDIGIKQNQIGEFGYQYILTGDPKYLKAIEDIGMPTEEDILISESRLEDAVRSAAKLLPMMADVGAESITKGLATGAGFGTIAAIAGQAGPQIAVPEELVTVPVATLAGFKVGATAGAYEAALRKEAGLALSEIINFEDKEGNRIDPDLARATAFGVGAINAGLEVVQIRTLLRTIPGVDKIFSDALMKTVASKSVKNKLLSLAGAFSETVVKETGQEVAQESVNIVFEELSKKLNNELKGTDIEPSKVFDILERLKTTAFESAQGFAVLAAPGIGARAVIKAPTKPVEGIEPAEPIKGVDIEAPPIEVPEKAIKATEDAGTVIIGVDEDKEGNPVVFTIADSETGNIFQVPADATKGEIQAEVDKLREPEIEVPLEKAPEIVESELDRIIETDINIEAEADLIFGEDILEEEIREIKEGRPILEIIKDLNASIGEKGAITLGRVDLEDIKQQIEKSGVEISVIESKDDKIILSKIIVPKDIRGQGIGTQSMQRLMDYADRNNKTIALTPSKDFGGGITRLKKFYKDLGFVENKGKNKDFTISESMLRLPERIGLGEKGAIFGEDAARITPILAELGNSIWQQGATTFNAFKTVLQKSVGETWESIKHLALKTWEMAKRFNERLGEVGAVGVQPVKNMRQLAKSLGGIDFNKEHMKGELNKLGEDVPATKRLINKKGEGVTLDALLESAIEAGILSESAGIDDVIVALEMNLETQEAIEEGMVKEQRVISRLEEKEFTNAELRRAFVDASIKARKAFREGKAEGVAKQKAIMVDRISRLKARTAVKIDKIKTDKDILANRRGSIKAVQNEYNLTDSEVKKLVRKDPRLMTNYEFKLFKDDMKVQALELKKKKEAKIALIKTIKDLRLQKVDNYRRALGMPSFDKMTIEQLQKFDALMQEFEFNDIFLTQRELETVDRTDTLKGIRTWREAKEQLSKEIGVPVEELDAIQVSGLDSFRWDTSLMERNPVYNLLVNQVTTSMMNAEARFHGIESKVFELAKKSEKSRKRTLVEKAIPQDKQIFDYLEATDNEKAELAGNMTPEQIEFAEYIKIYFENALLYLFETKSLEKGRDNYFTHMRRTYLESVRDDGLLKATLDMFKNYQQDAMVFNILDDDTGNILPLEKFFQFSLQRTGALEPSKNITKVFLNYVKTFERKVSFDRIIPKMDIYAQALTPQKLTPRGLEADRSLKKFVNKYINNKKGRRISYDSVIKQGGEIDLSLNALRTFVTMLDLGFSIPIGLASFLGEQIATTTMLGSVNYAKGVKRMTTKKGKDFLKKYEVFTGRSLFEEFPAPGKQVTERLADGMFGLFHISTVTANKQFLLGTITDAEWKAGEITPERLAELKLEMGRFRPIPGTASLVGATAPGRVFTQYKTWAIPIVRTLSKDIMKMSKDMFKRKPGALITKEAKEVYRAVSLTGISLVVLSMASGDIDDDDMIGKTLVKLRREALTLLQSFSVAFWLGVPRTAKWLEQLGKNLEAIILLETYKTRPGLKGVEGLKRQFTPGSVKALLKDEK